MSRLGAAAAFNTGLVLPSIFFQSSRTCKRRQKPGPGSCRDRHSPKGTLLYAAAAAEHINVVFPGQSMAK